MTSLPFRLSNRQLIRTAITYVLIVRAADYSAPGPSQDDNEKLDIKSSEDRSNTINRKIKSSRYRQVTNPPH